MYLEDITLPGESVMFILLNLTPIQQWRNRRWDNLEWFVQVQIFKHFLKVLPLLHHITCSCSSEFDHVQSNEMKSVYQCTFNWSIYKDALKKSLLNCDFSPITDCHFSTQPITDCYFSPQSITDRHFFCISQSLINSLSHISLIQSAFPPVTFPSCLLSKFFTTAVSLSLSSEFFFVTTKIVSLW